MAPSPAMAMSPPWCLRPRKAGRQAHPRTGLAGAMNGAHSMPRARCVPRFFGIPLPHPAISRAVRLCSNLAMQCRLAICARADTHGVNGALTTASASTPIMATPWQRSVHTRLCTGIKRQDVTIKKMMAKGTPTWIALLVATVLLAGCSAASTALTGPANTTVGVTTTAVSAQPATPTAVPVFEVTNGSCQIAHSKGQERWSKRRRSETPSLKR